MKKIFNFFSDLRYNTFRICSNIRYYLPIILHCNDWDHDYCLELYVASLKRLKTSLEDDPYGDQKAQIKNLNTVIHLMSEYIRLDGEGLLELVEYYDNMFQIPTEYRDFYFVKSEKDGYSTMKDSRELFLGKEQYIVYRNKTKDISKQLASKMKIRLLLAFKIISRQSKKWWT